MPPASDLEGAQSRRAAALVRHGHFPRPEGMASAHLLLPLSSEGKEQARRAAATLLQIAERCDLEIDSLIESSQLLRASQTARIIAEELSRLSGRLFEVEDRDEMIERGLGSCANLRLDEIEKILADDDRLAPLPQNWRRLPDFRLPVPGAESLMEAGIRTAARIDASLASIPADDDRDVLRIFVAHAGCLRHAAVSKGALDRTRVRDLTMDYAQSIIFEQHREGAWRLIAGEWKKREAERRD